MTQIATRITIAQVNDPIIHPASLKRLAGVSLRLPRSEFDLAVSGERARMASLGVVAGIYPAGQVFSIVGEEGWRVWTVGTGATAADASAASHARTVELRNGLRVTLPGDANTVSAVTGAPAPATGVQGDAAVDWSANRFYLKGPAGWASAGNVFPSGGGYSVQQYDPPTDNPDNTLVLFARQDNAKVSTSVFTRVFNAGIYHFNIGFNAAGQTIYAGPWGAGPSGGVEYPPGSGQLY